MAGTRPLVFCRLLARISCIKNNWYKSYALDSIKQYADLEMTAITPKKNNLFITILEIYLPP